MNKGRLKLILEDINSIALIGASPNPDRDSYHVMKYLIEKGYEIFPVNPKMMNKEILGIKCFSTLKEIEKKIDMVDIFRKKDFVMDITKDAIKLGVEVIWTQEGVIDEKSSNLAKNKGIIFVMNKCPKKVLES